MLMPKKKRLEDNNRHFTFPVKKEYNNDEIPLQVFHLHFRIDFQRKRGTDSQIDMEVTLFPYTKVESN